MTIQHKSLAQGRWKELTFLEQMANIGSEVSRALNWRAKNPEYCRQAFERALELTDLTLQNVNTFPRRREVARMREMLVDYFAGDNIYHSTGASWRNYFLAFAYAARRNR